MLGRTLLNLHQQILEQFRLLVQWECIEEYLMLTKIKLSGLTCQSCKKLTEMKIAEISGVTEVVVNLEQKNAEIIADRKITIDEINTVLKETHYKAYE